MDHNDHLAYGGNLIQLKFSIFIVSIIVSSRECGERVTKQTV